jgi:hypothetical protein
MGELYREEESFWVYKDDVPYTRKSDMPDTAFMHELQMRFPHSRLLRSFAPLKAKEYYND